MAKADTSVKWFHSDMPGAPVLRGEPGALIEVLDACLLNGFDPRTPDSITVLGEVATVTLGGGNPFEKHAVIAIAGASVAGLNAEWRIATSAATSFTFACPGVADGSVTGATVKRAGAAWGKPFSDTNKAAYQSLDPNSTQLYLRVDDTFSRYAQLRGYEQMTAIDVGTGLFPTAAQLASGVSWAKSNEGNANAKKWALFADGSMFYFYQATYGTTNPTLGAFGDMVSFLPTDKYHCVIAGSSLGANTAYPGFNAAFLTAADNNGVFVARSSSQVGSSQNFFRSSIQTAVQSNRVMGYGVPVPVNGEVMLRAPVFVTDNASSNTYRGYLPGLLEPMHRAFTSIETTPFEGIGPFVGRQIVGYSVGDSNYYGSVALDVTGPWR